MHNLRYIFWCVIQLCDYLMFWTASCRLVDNPFCSETTETSKSYCKLPVENASSLYSTPQKNCISVPCSSNQIASPTCRCQYPYKGILQFRGVFFSDYANPAPYASLESSLLDFFSKNQLPVDSVSVSDPRTDPYNYFLLSINIFPFGVNHFNHSAVSAIGSAFSTQAFKPPSDYFGPYVFHGDQYDYFSGNFLFIRKCWKEFMFYLSYSGTLFSYPYSS